uniref:Uncharacterized protein n=1 Tax=Anguilla anguilla TaxID=7936 RepID=A0A0E9X5A5_ANGAN
MMMSMSSMCSTLIFYSKTHLHFSVLNFLAIHLSRYNVFFCSYTPAQ